MAAAETREITPLKIKAGATVYRDWESDTEARSWPDSVGELAFRIYRAMEEARHLGEQFQREGGLVAQ